MNDAEAKARTDFDIRWKAALAIEIEDRPFARSTLQVFRAQLILHDKVREVFEQSLRSAREAGYLKGKRGMRVAMDTTYVLGRGAVKDTYNLLADGIVKRKVGHPEVSPHQLRHFHASVSLNQRIHPAVVSQRLGHANTAITMKVYTHALPGWQAEAADEFARVMEESQKALRQDDNGGDIIGTTAADCRPNRPHRPA